MNTGWAPKPLRPAADTSLFGFSEPETVVKGLSPMERQRQEDGTPYTNTPRTGLRPADPQLLLKGSLVAQYAERPKLPQQDPVDPVSVVKSFLAAKPAVASKTDTTEMTKSMTKLAAAIADFKAKTGAE